MINCATYLQKYSPLGVDRQVPPFLHGDGEQDTKPEMDKNILTYEKVMQIKIAGSTPDTLCRKGSGHKKMRQKKITR